MEHCLLRDVCPLIRTARCHNRRRREAHSRQNSANLRQINDPRPTFVKSSKAR